MLKTYKPNMKQHKRLMRDLAGELGAILKQDQPNTEGHFLTLREAATVAKISVKTLSNRISQYRRDAGSDPSWLIKSKGRKPLVLRRKFEAWLYPKEI